MISNTVTLDRADGVGHLTLNFPAKANTLTMQVLAALEDKLSLLEADRSIRLVLLQGAGDRFFCAGGAFDDWGQMSAPDMGRTFIRTTNRVIDRIEMLDSLTVAWLNGDAIGGGLELALATDMRIAHSHARLYLPELSIGAVPGMRGIQRLSALIGQGRAKDMVLTGKRLDAQTALDWGLVSAIEDDLSAVQHDLIKTIAKQSGTAMMAAKQMFRALGDGPSGAHAVHEIAGTASRFSDDGREGLAALMQKRKPDFGGGTAE
ncbi:enoyl-CoA hydratase/isomerase family protein [Ruegeria sp. EL01]|uniref:enoyl-CoA hydratase/isomerase family protein n=1 Tax=Ruegeria sp. EL01 TaxID=2107578 RepID=UPI000EA836CE|nr:enoyl-CoA hydratase/isomerase family protein [Ruegeria sp. EL01]